MSTSKFVVIKVSRPDPITDKPINFPPLKNLHLELLEIKRKLKKNIPAISVRKPEQQPQKEDSDSDSESEADAVMSEFKASGASAASAGASSSSAGETKAPAKDEALKEDDTFSISSDDAKSIVSVEEAPPELSPEEKEKLEQEEKEELIVKFRTLKKAYPQNKDLQLLSYDEHDDLETMRKMYKRTVNEIAFDRKIANYRSYLSVSFMVIEYGFRYLGMNMEGFAKHQAQSIDDYNSLLVELGEKTQGSWMDNFPVEVRLMGLVLFQAVVFWFAKNKNIDISNIMNVVSGMVPKQEPAPVELPTEQPVAPVKKMKGPTLKPKIA